MRETVSDNVAPTHSRWGVYGRTLFAASWPGPFCVHSSLTGLSALAAVPHVLRVELHLDGDAVEAKLGVEQISGVLQHRLCISPLLWCGMRKQEKKHLWIQSLQDQEEGFGFVGSPMARWTETSAWLTVRAQRWRQWMDLTFGMDSSTSFTELNSIPFGAPRKRERIWNVF